MYDLLIKGGTIIDGTQSPRFVGDLAIKDGIVERIDGNIRSDRAKRVIDATGKIVAPGVIDSHTHYDAQMFWDPYASNTGWHGGTTVAIGNCGFGFAPCERDPAKQARVMKLMEHTEQIAADAMRAGLDWDWDDLPSWINRLRRVNKGVNVAVHMPLNILMAYVMGMDEAKTRAPTREEMGRMKILLNEGMEAGAIGFAFTFQGFLANHVDFDGSFMPTDCMQPEVAYELAEVLRDRGHGVIQVNCDKVGGTDNKYIAKELAKVSGQRVLFNLLSVFEGSDGAHVSRLEWLDEVEKEGLNIYSQGHQFRPWVEFTVNDTNMWDPVPFLRQFCVADKAEKLRMAADSTFRAELKRDYDPKMMVTCGGGLGTYMLINDNGSGRFAKYKGETLATIVEREQSNIVDVFLDLVLESEGAADFRTTKMLVDDVDIVGPIMEHKRVVAGTSDGGAHNKFWAGGYYPTDIIKFFSRETNKFDLELLHAKFSLLPARALGLHKRGALIEGWAADAYIYDYDKIDHPPVFEKKYDLPGGEWRVDLPSIGIDWTIVNGEPTLKGMEPTGAYPGRIVGSAGAEMDERLNRPVEARVLEAAE